MSWGQKIVEVDHVLISDGARFLLIEAPDPKARLRWFKSQLKHLRLSGVHAEMQLDFRDHKDEFEFSIVSGEMEVLIEGLYEQGLRKWGEVIPSCFVYSRYPSLSERFSKLVEDKGESIMEHWLVKMEES